MARITVEDCLKNVKNRFELVLVAAKRARQLMHGRPAKVEQDNDKATVIALREIAEGYTNFDVEDPKEENLIELRTPPLEKHEEPDSQNAEDHHF